MARPKKETVLTVAPETFQVPEAPKPLSRSNEPDGVRYTKDGAIKYAPSDWIQKTLEAEGWTKD